MKSVRCHGVIVFPDGSERGCRHMTYHLSGYCWLHREKPHRTYPTHNERRGDAR